MGVDRRFNDLAILNHLTYWTKCNAAVMERMYLETHMDHSKWHSSDAYRTATINKQLKAQKYFKKQGEKIMKNISVEAVEKQSY